MLVLNDAVLLGSFKVGNTGNLGILRTKDGVFPQRHPGLRWGECAAGVNSVPRVYFAAGPLWSSDIAFLKEWPQSIGGLGEG